ncbi:MAG: zinc-dependent metalloprotease [candidate division Zixibacteria bacterium]|nr:zinc-dependent metalloprotease [candidate division Zixibacteria bacterium]
MRTLSLRTLIISVFLLVFGLTLTPTESAMALSRGDSDSSSDGSKKGDKDDKDDKKKDFKEVVEDFEKVEGLFDLYVNSEDGKVYLAIKPDQLNVIYLCGITRSRGDGSYYDSGAMGAEFPFFFKKVAKTIQMIVENDRIRADKGSSLEKAVERGVSNSLFASSDIVKSKPGPDDEILVDASKYFVRDVANTGYFLGTLRKTGFSFDKSNSHFGPVKSFEQNTEIDVNLYFSTKKPADGQYLNSPYAMIHTYHYSLSTLPESNFKPRLADDRVGHFLTLYQDYTNLDTESPYVRYVNRWDLQKEEPYADMSKPVNPIVFWLENTIPEEFRKSVAEGVLYWNKSYEKIGFKDALVVKQMPDDADWDPADVRYNTIRWMVMPGAGYAVGPSRVNPYTGQIYDADIRISADFIRYMFNYVETQVKPVAYGADFNPPVEEWEAFYHSLEPDQKQRFCNYGDELAREAGYAYSIISVRNDFDDKDEITKKFVHQYIVDLVAHEVGHTLGFRHNFKSSTMNSTEQLCDESFTREKGLIASCMDYAPANIAPEGMEQGEFFVTTPGPYDDWVVEYAYKQLEAGTTIGELDELAQISRRAAEAGLQYGTDEDALGGSVRSIDPTCNYFDLGDDPMVYYRDRCALTDELWSKIENAFEKDGVSYEKIRRVFSAGWRGYRDASRNISKYVGGYYHNRSHVGDPGATVPFTPVPASRQIEAVNFLVNEIFASSAFETPARLLNKLQPVRFPDFKWSIYYMPRIDFPLHQTVMAIQANALYRLYASTTLHRIEDQARQYGPGEEIFSMSDLFKRLRRGIWTELQNSGNVDSYRRNLQLEHLKILQIIYLSTGTTFPQDARSLAYNDLSVIAGAIDGIVSGGGTDEMTTSHLKRVASDIRATMNANVSRKL